MTEGKSSKMGSLSMKKEREAVLAYMWSKPTPHELDVIDKGTWIGVRVSLVSRTGGGGGGGLTFFYVVFCRWACMGLCRTGRQGVGPT